MECVVWQGKNGKIVYLTVNAYPVAEFRHRGGAALEHPVATPTLPDKKGRNPPRWATKYFEYHLKTELQVPIFASSRFHVDRLYRGFYLDYDSVTEPPPGRPSGAATCIVCGGVGANSPHKMHLVH